MITVSPQIGEFLIKVTQLPDIEAALKRVLTEYLDLKISDLKAKIKGYESKWKMTFKEFEGACKNKTLKTDVYSYEVEKDFWEWEGLESVLKYYEDAKSKWI
ncbi:MAG: hypothetical protein HZA00_12330 [Nitrospinae bacterium]|nr:hypothetical protein [Nitrospinota bacterium]